MEYNERIKQYRTQKGATQQQLADDIGVSRQSVVRWENGFTVPSMYYAQKLAQYFGVTVTELMTGVDEKSGETQCADADVKYKLSVTRFCIACLAIATVYILVRGLVWTVRYWYIQTGRDGAELRTVMGALYYTIDAVAAAAAFSVLAFWILRLVKWLNSSDNKFLLYRRYRLWNIGVIVWLASIVAAAFVTYAHISYLLTACIAVATAAVVDYLFDFVFKKIYGKRMVVPCNKAVNIVNLVFAVIGIACIAVVVGLILYEASDVHSNGLGTLFALFYLGIAMAVIILAYIVVRAVLHTVYVRRSNKEQ